MVPMKKCISQPIQGRLRQGVELGLAILERWFERQAHLHATALAFRLAQRLLQLFGACAVPGQDIGPRLGDIR
jgi:hypothetical protein